MENFEEEDFDEELNEKDGETWKPVYTLNKQLQEQNKKITATISALMEVMGDKDELTKSHLEMMLGDSWNVGAKLAGAFGGDIYLIYMENASIIRSLMRQMKTSTYGLDVDDDNESEEENPYVLVLRDEIEEFRNIFRQWVETFQKDDFEDEWGLY